MKALVQDAGDRYLSVFPRLNEIGGVFGHRLDIYADKIWTFKVRFSLDSIGVLALEQIVIYGQLDSNGDVIELTKIQDVKVDQSSIALLSGEESEVGLPRHGPKSAINGIINGYNRIETLEEDTPFWTIEFPNSVRLETIHVNYCCISGYIHYSNKLKIEYWDGDKWSLLYDRSAGHVIAAKYENLIKKLHPIGFLRAKSTKQRNALRGCWDTIQKLCDSNLLSLTRDEICALLDFSELFLPIKSSPAREIFSFKNIPEVRSIAITGIQSGTIVPIISLTYLDFDNSLRLKTYHELTFELPQQIDILTLDISFEQFDEAHQACCFNLEVSSVSINSNGDDWTTIYSHAEIVDLCGQVAWAAYLTGDESARCIGLVAKSILMARRDDSSLNEAYYWCRLKFHGRPTEYRHAALAIINSATKYERPDARLSFGRHSFTTKLGNRDQQKYILALQSTIQALADMGLSSVILYGTLLGAVREGGFIDHDDDVDLAYFTNADTIEKIITERDAIIESLLTHGFDVAPLEGHAFLTFSIAPRDYGEKFWVELFPIWQNPELPDCYNLYMDLMNIKSVPKSIIGTPNDISEARINGVKLPAPKSPVEFVTLRYGPKWNIPDQFFEI